MVYVRLSRQHHQSTLSIHTLETTTEKRRRQKKKKSIWMVWNSERTSGEWNWIRIDTTREHQRIKWIQEYQGIWTTKRIHMRIQAKADENRNIHRTENYSVCCAAQHVFECIACIDPKIPTNRPTEQTSILKGKKISNRETQNNRHNFCVFHIFGDVWMVITKAIDKKKYNNKTKWTERLQKMRKKRTQTQTQKGKKERETRPTEEWRDKRDREKERKM